MHRRQRRTRVGTQLVGEQLPSRGEDLEGLRLASAGGQRPHQQLRQLLTPRLVGARLGEHGCHGPRVETGRERGPRPRLRGRQSLTAEGFGDPVVQRLPHEVDQRSPSPVGEGGGERGGGATLVAGSLRGPPTLSVLAVGHEVALVTSQGEAVARSHRRQEVRDTVGPGSSQRTCRQGLAPGRHVGLDEVGGRRRGVLAPDTVDDRGDGDDGPGLECEHGQEAAAAAARRADRAPVERDLERPEHGDVHLVALHRCSASHLRRSSGTGARFKRSPAVSSHSGPEPRS